MITTSNLSLQFGSQILFEDVSVKFTPGNCYGLIGANGAGKTTTLMSISGIVPPRQGEILFENEPLADLNPNEIVQRGLCHIPEGRRIFPYLTVTENLDMGAFLRDDTAAIKQDLDYIFELFPILAERRNQAGGENGERGAKPDRHEAPYFVW